MRRNREAHYADGRFVHKDGRGYTLQLETCPINGRIVLRLPLEDAPEADNEAGRS